MKRILTVLAAVTAFAAISAAPALASQPAPAQPASAHAAKAARILRAGSILCSGDLCLQTLSIAGPPFCTAVVREWPYQVNLYGHFEITAPFDNHYTQNSRGGDHWWRAGIDGYNFTVPVFNLPNNADETYYGIAWQHTNGSYSHVGIIGFGIGPVADNCPNSV
jgi:hypothetical protein